MSVTTIILLPQAPSANDRTAHWWTIDQGLLTGSGVGEEWLEQVSDAAPVIALAPTAAVRCVFAPAQGLADRQALGVARSAAVVGGLADPATLHAVSAFVDSGEGAPRRTVTAVVANSMMLEWLDWLDRSAVNPMAIVPVGLLVPQSAEWWAAAIGSDHLLIRDGQIIPDEPAFRAHLVGADEVHAVESERIEERLAALPGAVPLNLRTGRFARRRILVLDRARLRELALLAALIPLLGLLMAIVTIVRLNSDSRALEQETAALASDRLGRQVEAEGAGAALNARLAEQVGAAGSPFSPLSAVYQQLQLTPAVGAQALAWRGDGTLSATLAAPRADDLNRVLIGLQAAGYRITAVPRQGSDGRAMTDITVRSAP